MFYTIVGTKKKTDAGTYGRASRIRVTSTKESSLRS